MKKISQSINTFFFLLLFTNMLFGCSRSNNTNLLPHPASETRLQLGFAYLEKNSLSAAYFNINKALILAPNNAQAHLAMALYQEQIGEKKVAEKSYQHALKLSPNNAHILIKYGHFLCHNTEYAKAQLYLKKAKIFGLPQQIAESLRQSAYCFIYSGGNDALAKKRFVEAARYDLNTQNFLLKEIDILKKQQIRKAELLINFYKNHF